MTFITPHLSKTVGWSRERPPWPTLEEVNAAAVRGDHQQLLVWLRFLPSPATEEQVAVIGRLAEMNQT